MTDHPVDANKMVDHPERNLDMVKAAREAGFDCAPDGHIYNAGTDDQTPLDEQITRFYAIAYRAGMERAAEICESRANMLMLPSTSGPAILSVAAAIRAEASKP